MKEKNKFEKIKIKDLSKRSLTEIYDSQKIQLKLIDENDEDNKINEGIISNNDRGCSVNIYIEDQITKKDLDLIKQFKEYCLNIKFRYDVNIFNDLLLLRFLKANNYNMKSVQKKIINYIKFFGDYLLNEIKISEFPNIDKIKIFYPHGFHKTSIIGEPIFIQMLGQLKIDDINKLLKEPLLTKYIIFKLTELEKEIFPKCSLYYKRKIDKIFCIFDLMGLTTSLMNKKIFNFIQKQINIVTNYFPGILGSLYFINTGFIFRSIWTACKYLYDNKTRNRIKLIGFQYKNDLLNKIKEKNLPKFFGGLCNCEPYGCLFSNKGPWNDNKIINEGDKRRTTNFLEMIDKKKKILDDKEDDFEEIEENNIEELNNIVINQNNINIDNIKGPNDI
jgi:hypothetical protein